MTRHDSNEESAFLVLTVTNVLILLVSMMCSPPLNYKSDTLILWRPSSTTLYVHERSNVYGVICLYPYRNKIKLSEVNGKSATNLGKITKNS